MDPRQMEQIMKKMGMKHTDIDSLRVIIECENENIIIENPNVTEIEMQGQKSYQIAGTVKKEDKISEEDLKMVMEQADAGKEEAKKALNESKGNIAEAILKLKETT